MEFAHRRELMSTLLPGEATLAQLLHMINSRETPHHLLLGQQLKPMETKMAIPHVPLPGDVIPVRREAHRHADVEVECVQTVLHPLHPR